MFSNISSWPSPNTLASKILMIARSYVFMFHISVRAVVMIKTVLPRCGNGHFKDTLLITSSWQTSPHSLIFFSNEYLGFTNTFAYRQVHRTWCIVIWPIGSSYWCNIWEFCNPPSITGTSGKLGHWVDSKYISNVFSPECKAMKFQSILIGMRWIFSIESWQLGWYRCNQCCITSINCPLSQNNTEVSQWSRVTKDILPAIFFIAPLLIDASLPINENTFQNWSKSPEWLISEANDCKCHRIAAGVEQ